MPQKNVKKRNWTFVAYPESLPRDWIDQLRQTGLQVAISPLHDRDVNPDGTLKKPHYHVILVYGNTTTYNSVKALTNGRLGQTVPQPLEQVRGMYRYFTHDDNPEKVQYSKAEIQHLNGFDIRDFVELTKTEVNKIIRCIQEYIQDNNVIEYSDLLDVLRVADGLDDWYDVAIGHTLLFTAYLRSRREKQRGRDVQNGA